MRIVALGTTQFLLACADGLRSSGIDVCCLISLPSGDLPDNSCNIKAQAAEWRCEYFEVSDINSTAATELLSSLKPDIIFSAWPKIIKGHVLAIPRFGVIGSHPTPLPRNRGRHPLHWQIVLGISDSKLSFFKMDEGVDSGPILLQSPYSITPDDTTHSLGEKVNAVAKSAARQLGALLLDADGVPAVQPQDHSKASYWRKRGWYDVIIDPRMTSEDILRLIKSFAVPYPCALLVYEDNVYHITHGRLLSRQEAPDDISDLEPGKVLKTAEHSIQFRCADSAVEVTTREPLTAQAARQKYIFPPSKYFHDNPRLFAEAIHHPKSR